MASLKPTGTAMIQPSSTRPPAIPQDNRPLGHPAHAPAAATRPPASPAQAKLMNAVEHDKKFSDKVGIPQAAAKKVLGKGEK